MILKDADGQFRDYKCEGFVIVLPDQAIQKCESFIDAKRKANAMSKKDMGNKYTICSVFRNGTYMNEETHYQWFKMTKEEAKARKEKPYMFR